MVPLIRDSIGIASSRRLASSVLANFRKVAKTGEVRIHPMAARQVDPDLPRKLGAAVERYENG